VPLEKGEAGAWIDFPRSFAVRGSLLNADRDIIQTNSRTFLQQDITDYHAAMRRSSTLAVLLFH
jgi:hypothetical protein